MTKPVIVTRAGKGSALTWTEGDANVTNLQNATITIKADTSGTDVVSDLNGSITLVAGNNIALTGDNTAKTITIDSATPNINLNDLSDVTTSGATDGQVLTYNGTMMSWGASTPAGGGATQLGDLTDVSFSGPPSTGDALVYNDTSGKWEPTAISAGISDVVSDTTPQLGGNLDVNGNSIVSASNGNIAITPNGTGSIVLDGLNWPQADGTANYVLKTNGSGQLSWVAQTAAFDPASPGAIGGTTAAAGTFTTLTVNAANDLRLADSDSSNYVGFKAPTTVSANKIWTLPSVDGTNGQVLSTNGSAVLSWATAGGGASYAMIQSASNYVTLTATGTIGSATDSAWVESYDPSGIVTLSATGANNNLITLIAGTYILEFSSAGILASGSVSSNSKANTGAVQFNLYNETSASNVDIYYQESTQFWTGSNTSYEVGMGPMNLRSIVSPATTTTYSLKYTHGGLTKQINNFGNPGKAFRILITKIA